MKALNRFLRYALVAALAAAVPALPVKQANAAATTQTLHAFLCAPEPVVGSSGPRRVVNTSSTSSPQPSYVLNTAGCAVVAAADVGFFLSQGFYYGPNQFNLIQTGITASTTSTTSTITLPAYGYIQMIILEETAGNAITGGVDIGDSGSATRYASATALGANATVVVPDSGNARLFSNSGVPASDQILVVCHTSCNSGSININIIYGYY